VGFLAGAILGPFAFLLFFVSGVTRKPASEPTKVCGQCAEHVKAEAKVCRYCGAAFKW
jgi:predicted amidophosphoribosyltransferase